MEGQGGGEAQGVTDQKKNAYNPPPYQNWFKTRTQQKISPLLCVVQKNITALLLHEIPSTTSNTYEFIIL
jgi:hypothetical protein